MSQNGWETIRIYWPFYQKLNKKEKEDYIEKLIKYIRYKKTDIPILINKNVNSICKCGGFKYYRSKECSICSHIAQRKIKDRPSIELLKEEIKSIGYKGTGRKYNVSDNTIRRWIKNN